MNMVELLKRIAKKDASMKNLGNYGVVYMTFGISYPIPGTVDCYPCNDLKAGLEVFQDSSNPDMYKPMFWVDKDFTIHPLTELPAEN